MREDGTTGFPEEGARNLVYFVFDILALDGKDLKTLPLLKRKALLAKLLKRAPANIKYTEHITGKGPEFLEAACEMKVEGVVSKRADGPYLPDDRSVWRKSKCTQQEEFIIVGFTESESSRPHLSSLLLAYYDDEERLTYAGRGGGGMSAKQLADVYAKLKPLVVKKMPIAEAPPRTSRFGTPLDLAKVLWVKPKLVCEVRYLAWTEGGMLRQVRFVGLREDKPANEVRRPRPTPPAGTSSPTSASAERPSAKTRSGHFSRENVMRELDDAVVPTKDELKEYWKAVARDALPHLRRRPLTLVRSVGGHTFFHKGPLPPIPGAVHSLNFTKAEGSAGVRVWIDDLKGLLGLVDMDVVEVHPWGATVDDIEHADLIVFDLDPGEGIAWDFVTATALALRKDLEVDGLQPWVKTTGGKGLHVMVPLEEKMAWRDVRLWTKAKMESFAERDKRYTTSSALSHRKGRLFLDYLRNGRGNTAVGAYSPRTRPEFPVSVPISWKDAARGVESTHYTMKQLTQSASRRARKPAH